MAKIEMSRNHTIGKDAAKAVETLCKLVEGGFGEEE